mgnify:CR=1 FL=1
MQALAQVPSFILLGAALLCLVCGWLLRHGWGVRRDRANENRLAAMRDQLDAKDSRLQILRAELRAERERVVALQLELEAEPNPLGGPNDGNRALAENAVTGQPSSAGGDAFQPDPAQDHAHLERRVRPVQSQPDMPQLL